MSQAVRRPVATAALAVVFLAKAWAQAALDHAYDALRAHDYSTAIAGFRQAIEADPANLRVRKDLAYAYLKTGENSLALEQFGEAMRLDPADTQVALEFAFLANEQKDGRSGPAEARRIFDRIRRNGNSVAEQAFHNIDDPLAAGIDRWLRAIALGSDN